MNWFKRVLHAFATADEPTAAPQPKADAFSTRNLDRAREAAQNGYEFASKRIDYSNIQAKRFEIKAPAIMKGVVPQGEDAPVMAMDSCYSLFSGTSYDQAIDFTGFPGYPYLAMLATRAEYRQMASALSTELTREWVTINSSETAGEGTKKKVTELTKMLENLCIQQMFADAASDDCLFGRTQIAVNIKGQNIELPLVLSNKTIPLWKGGNIKTFPVAFKKVEPMWTTPANFNANDPLADDFYVPDIWYIMGKRIHQSRLLTVITRPVPDMLKPAFNFSGMSLSQLAEPYVNNWLRTRQSVSDLINNFSIIVLKTKLDTLVQNSGNLIARIKLFLINRSNNGVFVADKDREEVESINVPLSGLDALQAQSQEHLCSVSRMPAVILTGLSPQGLNPSADGEIRVFYDWIHAQQEAHWRKPLHMILCLLQYAMYGGVDEDITFTFDPLFQMTPKELSEIRKVDAESDNIYNTIGAIDNEEIRERLARDPRSGYSGLDLGKKITPPEQEDANDNESEDDDKEEKD